MIEMYSKEELKQLREALLLSKEMMHLYCSDDGKLKYSIPMIGMMEGILIEMTFCMAMHIQIAHIATKRGQSFTQSESLDFDIR